MKKVTLLGCAYSRREIDFNTEDEIWILNDMYKNTQKYHRVFDIHSDENIKKRGAVEGFASLDVPVYMQRAWEEIPMSKAYPLKEIYEAFYIDSMGDKLFTTCTVSYMLALAIYEGFTEITLLGIDQSVDTEYEDEMPSVIFWLGLARGRGIKINVSDHSPLLKGYFLYGYEQKQKKQINIFAEKELQRIHEIKDTAIRKQEYFFAEENKCIGAETILNHMIKLFNNI